MTQNEFNNLSMHLRSVAKDIPFMWGAVQNDPYDSKLKKEGYSLFDINTLDELKRIIKDFSDDYKIYYCRRWFILKCSRCEEFLFYNNENVILNPQTRSKNWDIRIDRQYQIKGESFICTHYFDVKSARISSQFINNKIKHSQSRDEFVNETINDPHSLIKYFYDNQSDGVRFDMQNRLFIVHHSFVDNAREMLLRTAWKTKATAAKAFLDRINDIVLYSYRGCTAGIIFILERKEGTAEFYIPGL